VTAAGLPCAGRSGAEQELQRRSGSAGGGSTEAKQAIVNARPAVPRVTVIIRARNEAAHLPALLAALGAQAIEGGLEVLLVDDHSQDGTARIAADAGARVLALASERFSFGRALNLAAQAAQGEYLALLSADALPLASGYLARLVEPLADPRVAATYGRQVPGPGCCPSEARDLAEWFPEAACPLPRPFLSNAGAALRREVWQRYPFDERVASAEDALWAAQVVVAGYRVVYVPEALVRHSHAASPGVAYQRGCRDAHGLRHIDSSLRRFGLWRVLRMAGGLSWWDWGFALHQGYGLQWWPHIPLYRLAQAWGIYCGVRKD
jgi:rhamnosyltransferase